LAHIPYRWVYVGVAAIEIAGVVDGSQTGKVARGQAGLVDVVDILVGHGLLLIVTVVFIAQRFDLIRFVEGGRAVLIVILVRVE
jgi:hypothetical protein